MPRAMCHVFSFTISRARTKHETELASGQLCEN